VSSGRKESRQDVSPVTDLEGDFVVVWRSLGSSSVTVQLREAVTHSLVDSGTSGVNGFFGFAAAPGTYYLEVVLPSGFAFAPRDQGASDGADSDTNPTTGTTILFTLGAGGPARKRRCRHLEPPDGVRSDLRTYRLAGLRVGIAAQILPGVRCAAHTASAGGGGGP